MARKDHWNEVYTGRPTEALSWQQRRAARSLALITASGVASDTPIIDVGGGASSLVADLLAQGHENLWVLDISSKALALARESLGDSAAQVHWIEADVCDARLPTAYFGLWHDRAVFHFLTEPAMRAAYVAKASQSLAAGGHLIIATFAEDGPTQCSGLPVARYDAAALQSQFGVGWALLHTEKEIHRTPTGTAQAFRYCHLQRNDR